MSQSNTSEHRYQFSEFTQQMTVILDFRYRYATNVHRNGIPYGNGNPM